MFLKKQGKRHMKAMGTTWVTFGKTYGTQKKNTKHFEGPNTNP